MATIRLAKITDADAIAKVQVDGWQSAFKGIVPQDYLDSLTYEGRSERLRALLAENKPRFHALVAVDDNVKIIGFSCGGLNRIPVGDYDGELWAIYVDIHHQGAGIGRELVKATVAELRAVGFTKMVIWCLDRNPYCRFYERLGGQIVGEKWDDIGGANLKQFGYGWSSLEELI